MHVEVEPDTGTSNMCQTTELRAALKLARARVLCQNAGPLQICNQLTS